MNILTSGPGPAPACLFLCLSHLRWDLVFQRPQHLLTRAARDFDVVYVEEPVTEAGVTPQLRSRRDISGVTVLTPVLPEMLGADRAVGQAARDAVLRRLLDAFLARRGHDRLFLWYYTPMALAFTDHLKPAVTVFDCMDELSAFKDPPPGLLEAETRLLARADIVFTGGQSLYAAKRDRHPRVRCYPSSVDATHFGRARAALADPADQSGIGRPRIGFFGVIDERMDLPLVAAMAAALPRVQFVFLGPVVKISDADLPRAWNIHWLGPKSYADLPAYLANWDAGWMPFALNEATRFISPTKTPEFLAAGLALTSTAVPDVVGTYGAGDLVGIAGPADMAGALQASLSRPPPAWRRAVDAHLAQGSWDRTWAAMRREMMALARRSAPLPLLAPIPRAAGLEVRDA
ncbi:MAG: hypothetical protein RIR62_1774 [Pseudomonadota bacterium]|jgi:glycosyltransferase involved in cell wall biosynthesis